MNRYWVKVFSPKGLVDRRLLRSGTPLERAREEAVKAAQSLLSFLRVVELRVELLGYDGTREELVVGEHGILSRKVGKA